MAQAVTDIGPAADQNNIAIGGETVNNIAITHQTKPGPVLLSAKVIFSGAALNEQLDIRILRNGVPIPGTGSTINFPLAGGSLPLYTTDSVADSQPGDVYTIYAYASAATADILANRATLTMLGVPAQHSLAPQAVATP